MVDFQLSERYWASKPKDYPISKGIDWDSVREDDDPFRYSYVEHRIPCKNICDRQNWDEWKMYYKKILKLIFRSEKMDLYSTLTYLL